MNRILIISLKCSGQFYTSRNRVYMLQSALYQEELSLYVVVSIFLPHSLLLLRDDTSELLMSIFLITLSSAFSNAYHTDCGGKAVEPRRLNVKQQECLGIEKTQLSQQHHSAIFVFLFSYQKYIQRFTKLSTHMGVSSVCF